MVLLLSMITWLSFIVASSMADCSSICEFGTCVNSVCQCDANFVGPDCSIPSETCPDGERNCLNGSECARNNEKDSVTKAYKYHCDCSKAFAVSSFAGHECEYSAQEVCDYGTSNSLKSFCTNAGTCVKIIFKGEPHAACACPTEFEGVHCQYLVGTAPASELLLAMYQDTEKGMTGLAIFFIIFISFGLVALFVIVVWRQRRKEIRAQEGFPLNEVEANEFRQTEEDNEALQPKQIPDIS